MKIAYTMAQGRGDTDFLLFRVSEELAKRGVKLAGTVQINTERDCDGPCDMDVRVLPEGPIIRISQNLGKHAKGCRLDPEALEGAVAHVEQSIQQGAECLIINKFGKHEADGRGFRDVIAEAIARDMPVLVGTNSMNRPAFLEYVDHSADELTPDLDAVLAWITDALSQSAAAA